MNTTRYIATTFLLILYATPILAQPDPGSRMAISVEQYYADLKSLEETHVLEEGPAYFDRMEDLYKRWLDRLDQMDYSSLDTPEAADFILLRRNIRRDLRELKQDRSSYNEIEHAIPFASIIYNLQKKRRVGENLDGKAFAEQLESLASGIREARKSVKNNGRLTAEESRRAVEVSKNLKKTLKHIYDFYKGYDPDVTWWAPKSYQKVDSTFTNYIGFLKDWRVEQPKKDDGSGIVGHPVGREKLLQLLDYEMIPYSPEELIQIAEKEYEWCMKEMLKASRELGYGDDWHAALEHVKKTYVPAGKQPEMIYGLYKESINFIEKRDLVTIPEMAKETINLKMMSPERQLINPFFLGGRSIIISYPTNTMSYEDKMMSMRGNNPHFSKATVHHELIAGHHLQWYMTARYNTHRRAFRTPFWTEGWALYWELQLYDMGFPDSAEDRIGMLFWRMHRCARIIFSLSYHLGKMSPQECIDFLVEKVGHEYANAEAEVRRSFAADYPPLYQAGYLLGGLQIRSLYNSLVENGDMPVKTFHDRFLKIGSMPIEMVRKVLTDQKPSKDFETNWRFYDGLD